MKRALVALALLAPLFLLASCTSVDGSARQQAEGTSSPSGSRSVPTTEALVGIWVPAEDHRFLKSLEFTDSGILIQTIQDANGRFVNQGTWSAAGPDCFACELNTLGAGVRRDTIQYSLDGAQLRLKQVSGDSWLLSELTPEVEFTKSK